MCSWLCWQNQENDEKKDLDSINNRGILTKLYKVSPRAPGPDS
jgi:hypothetical protein